jgi:hypothetical protein
VHAARALARLHQLAKGGEQLLLGSVDPAVRRRDVCAAGAAEREQRHVVVLAREALEHPRPLPRPLVITRQLTRLHQRAADIGERLQRCRLTTRRRRHRLIQVRQPLVHPPARDLGQAKLRQRPQLEIRITCAHPDRERVRRQGTCLRRVRGALRARQREPAGLGPGSDVAQQPLRARQPAVRRRLVAPHDRVLTRQPQRNPRSPGQLSRASETCVRTLTLHDRSLGVAQPPQRPPQCIQHLGRLIATLQRRLERRASGRPIGAGQSLEALLGRRRRTSSRHVS